MATATSDQITSESDVEVDQAAAKQALDDWWANRDEYFDHIPGADN